MEPNELSSTQAFILISGPLGSDVRHVWVTASGHVVVFPGNKPQLDALASILFQTGRIENQGMREAIAKVAVPALRAELNESVHEH